MKAEALYVIVTPEGRVSDCSAFTDEQAKARYVQQWMPPKVIIEGHLVYSLWQAFERVGFKVQRIDLPKAIEGKEVCYT